MKNLNETNRWFAVEDVDAEKLVNMLLKDPDFKTLLVEFISNRTTVRGELEFDIQTLAEEFYNDNREKFSNFEIEEEHFYEEHA